jgi:hypothetical protein
MGNNNLPMNKHTSLDEKFVGPTQQTQFNNLRQSGFGPSLIPQQPPQQQYSSGFSNTPNMNINANLTSNYGSFSNFSTNYPQTINGPRIVQK